MPQRESSPPTSLGTSLAVRRTTRTTKQPFYGGKPVITNEQLIPLSIPVPPMFEQALGYPGPLVHTEEPPARYVAFYWTEGGDEAAFDDLSDPSYGAFPPQPALIQSE